MQRIQSSTLMLTTLILVFAAIILIHGLDNTSLWADEGWTIAATDEATPIEVVSEWVVNDVHPPLFFIGLNIWRQFTGDTIFEMRYYSALITLIGVGAMYRLGQSMFSVRVGWLGATLFAMHDLVHVLTQEVRHYSLQQTLTILTLWLYWHFWQYPSRDRGVAFVLAGAALLYAHYWGGFVLLSIGIHMLLTRWQNIRPYIIASVAIGVLYTPWLPAIYNQITLERPGGLPHALENSLLVYETLANQLAGVPEWFWLIFGLAGLAGSLTTSQWREWRPTTATLLPWLVIVITIGLSLLVNTQYPTLSFRSLAVIVPPLMLLVAHTLSQFRPREFAIVMGFVMIQSLLTTGAAPVERPPWPELSTFLTARGTASDTLLLEMSTDDLPLMYYLEQDGNLADVASTETIRLNDAAEYQTMLTDELTEHDGVWLSKFGFFAYDPRPEIEAHGFVQSGPPVLDFGRYVDGRPIELYRFDRVPDDMLVSFGDVMQLMKANVSLRQHELTINLLWSPSSDPQRNYTISTFLLASNGLPPQPPNDSYPFAGRSPTINWTTGNYYFDTHSHNVSTLPAGSYQIGVKVYSFIDTNFTQLEIAPASDCAAQPACEFVIVSEIVIE